MKHALYILLISLMYSTLGYSQTANVSEGDRGVQDSYVNQNKIKIAVYENYLYVSNVSEGTMLVVKNMLGENVLSVRLNSSSEKIALDLKKGFYIVRVENELQRIVIK
ncbi:MAG: T9SS type A sorting domain-containing protein [Paludibacteraceae bacterium]|nr:T9SS type A sorting domain-containing protein [Paludibacteraceae bacterium]MBR2262453.1 T9SS type A sorting domain-containing protein [Paludibacteraceae bacterium]MEE3484103.1 T9SS type A sorting domain-containing protein [Bacteroidales bacterium]